MSGKVDDYDLLTKTDLKHFDGESWKLVQEMQDEGWRGRLASNGHVVMYAPDGVTTWTFSRDSLRGRSGRNARAVFTRWQKKQRAEVRGEDEEGVALERYICTHTSKDGFCGKEFGTPRALGIHKASHDREKVECPKCGRKVMYLETHLRKSHSEDTHKLLESLMNLFAEIEEIRAENAELRKLLGRD